MGRITNYLRGYFLSGELKEIACEIFTRNTLVVHTNITGSTSCIIVWEEDGKMYHRKVCTLGKDKKLEKLINFSGDFVINTAKININGHVYMSKLKENFRDPGVPRMVS